MQCSRRCCACDTKCTQWEYLKYFHGNWKLNGFLIYALAQIRQYENSPETIKLIAGITLHTSPSHMAMALWRCFSGKHRRRTARVTRMTTKTTTMKPYTHTHTDKCHQMFGLRVAFSLLPEPVAIVVRICWRIADDKMFWGSKYFASIAWRKWPESCKYVNIQCRSVVVDRWWWCCCYCRWCIEAKHGMHFIIESWQLNTLKSMQTDKKQMSDSGTGWWAGRSGA